MRKINPESAYIHIPFCIRKCPYCDFTSFLSNDEEKIRYLSCVKREIELTRLEMDRINVLQVHDDIETAISLQTIYFGGGTPSVVPASAIEEILIAIENQFGIDKLAEITIEVNPGTITKEKIKAYKSMGINRISVGIQSFSDHVLKKAGRIHTADEARIAVEMIQQVGFKNISCDLMTGLPEQTISDAAKSLQELLKYQIPHISFYALGIEENTPFYQRYHNHPDLLPSVDEERKMHHNLLEMIYAEKYRHYEISNCAQPGFESRHNLNYWKAKSYFGFGCGAHSYYDGKRRENTSDFKKYIYDLSEENALLSSVQQVEEVITLEEEKKEFLLLGFRILSGISEIEYSQRFRSDLNTDFGYILDQLVAKGYIDRREGKYLIADNMLDYANIIFREFV